MQYQFTVCGGTISEFEEMTLGDIYDVIITYGRMKKEEHEYYEKEMNKKNKNKNKTPSSSTCKSEKFSFGRAPELDTDFFKF